MKTINSRIGVQPIGYVDPTFLNSIISKVSDIYATVDINISFMYVAPQPLPVPALAFNENYTKYHISPFFSLGSYLMSLSEKKIKDKSMKLDKLFLITSVPLYMDMYTPILYGAADGGSPISLVSTAELAHGTKEQSIERVSKEASRFIGSTFGLSQCWDPECLMFACETLLDVDTKSLSFCDTCKSNIRT